MDTPHHWCEQVERAELTESHRVQTRRLLNEAEGFVTSLQ